MYCFLKKINIYLKKVIKNYCANKKVLPLYRQESKSNNKQKNETMTNSGVTASSAQTAIQIVIMDAIERGHTNPSELIKYMKTETFEKAVKSCLLIMEEVKNTLLINN